MKRRVFFGATTAAVACLALVMAGCDNGNGGGGGGDGFLGTTLELSGRVYESTWDENDNRIQVAFEGSKGIESAVFQTLGGNISVTVSGTITGGQLSVTVDGAPPDSVMMDIEDYVEMMGEYFDNITISNRNIRIASSDRLRTDTGRSIERARSTATGGEIVNFIYVDNDVTISGRGISRTWGYCDCEEWDGDCFCSFCDCVWMFHSRNFTLNLRAGWNAVRFTYEELETGERLTITSGNPANLRWVMWN